MDALQKRRESVSELIEKVQRGLEDSEESHDAETEAIADYLHSKLLEKLSREKAELLSMVDLLIRCHFLQRFLMKFLNSGCKYHVRVRSKYRKSREWGLWSGKHVISTKSLELRWCPQKSNNDPPPKFDAKHPNKVKLKEESVSKVAVAYSVNARRYKLFTANFKISKFHKKGSRKKGAVYLGFMPSNIDSHKLRVNGYINGGGAAKKHRKLHRRNVYYKVPLGNISGFDPVTFDPLSYCIEVKSGKSYSRRNRESQRRSS